MSCSAQKKIAAGRDSSPQSSCWPPAPIHPPTVFYSCIALGDVPLFRRILAVDPFFITQDNGAGAPIHFAASYLQLDMLRYLLDHGADINQQDRLGHRTGSLF